MITTKLVRLLLAVSLLVQTSIAIDVRAADPVTSTPHKQALLIALGKYNHGSMSDPAGLNSKPDIEAIRALLTRKQFGLEPADVTAIDAPKAPTHKSIVDAITRLIDETRPGHTVYIHFSGHTATKCSLEHLYGWSPLLQGSV